MKYIVGLAIVILTILIPLTGRIMPESGKIGTIVSLSEVVENPLPHKIATIEQRNGKLEAMLYLTSVEYEIGDKVSLEQDPQSESGYIVADKVRTPVLLQLFILFTLSILVVSGVSGIRSMLGLLFSFGVIFKFVLPQIVAGANPLTVALIASMIILMVSYFLTHGINHKSFIAVLGTLGALALTGILASIYASAAKLSGFGSEEVSFLVGSLDPQNFYNLLLAGMIIGSLGVLDDITISQASIVAELAEANRKFGVKELYIRAMKIGHDHISSLVNTLVLVYAGSALPLLLLFVTSEATTTDLLNYEMVAEEIVRTLVGSIGLVCAVPLTTLIAAYWYGNKR